MGTAPAQVALPTRAGPAQPRFRSLPVSTRAPTDSADSRGEAGGFRCGRTGPGPGPARRRLRAPVLAGFRKPRAVADGAAETGRFRYPRPNASAQDAPAAGSGHLPSPAPRRPCDGQAAGMAGILGQPVSEGGGSIAWPGPARSELDSVRPCAAPPFRFPQRSRAGGRSAGRASLDSAGAVRAGTSESTRACRPRRRVVRGCWLGILSRDRPGPHAFRLQVAKQSADEPPRCPLRPSRKALAGRSRRGGVRARDLRGVSFRPRGAGEMRALPCGGRPLRAHASRVRALRVGGARGSEPPDVRSLRLDCRRWSGPDPEQDPRHRPWRGRPGACGVPGVRQHGAFPKAARPERAFAGRLSGNVVRRRHDGSASENAAPRGADLRRQGSDRNGNRFRARRQASELARGDQESHAGAGLPRFPDPGGQRPLADGPASELRARLPCRNRSRRPGQPELADGEAGDRARPPERRGRSHLCQLGGSDAVWHSPVSAGTDCLRRRERSALYRDPDRRLRDGQSDRGQGIRGLDPVQGSQFGQRVPALPHCQLLSHRQLESHRIPSPVRNAGRQRRQSRDRLSACGHTQYQSLSPPLSHDGDQSEPSPLALDVLPFPGRGPREGRFQDGRPLHDREPHAEQPGLRRLPRGHGPRGRNLPELLGGWRLQDQLRRTGLAAGSLQVSAGRHDIAVPARRYLVPGHARTWLRRRTGS